MAKKININSLDELAEIVRKNCPACENGVFEIRLREIEELDDAGYPYVVGHDTEAVECQYCGELIGNIKTFFAEEDAEEQED